MHNAPRFFSPPVQNFSPLRNFPRHQRLSTSENNILLPIDISITSLHSISTLIFQILLCQRRVNDSRPLIQSSLTNVFSSQKQHLTANRPFYHVTTFHFHTFIFKSCSVGTGVNDSLHLINRSHPTRLYIPGPYVSDHDSQKNPQQVPH
jgi:hypothetical protein